MSNKTNGLKKKSIIIDIPDEPTVQPIIETTEAVKEIEVVEETINVIEEESKKETLIIESQDKEPTLIEQLEATNYHEMREKLNSLGIGDVFKHGLSKKDLIQAAIERLAIVKSIEGNDELTEEEKLEKINKAEIDKAKALNTDKQTQEAQLTGEQTSYKQSVINMNLSKEVLEKNLHSITMGIRNSQSKVQRDVLVMKSNAITEILKEKF